MSKHTKGPWEIDKLDGETWIIPIGVKIVFPNSKGIANARLIASSPDLLERLKDEASFLDAILDCAEVRDAIEGFFGKQFLEASDQARVWNHEVIAKAEGKDSK